MQFAVEFKSKIEEMARLETEEDIMETMIEREISKLEVFEVTVGADIRLKLYSSVRRVHP